MSGLRRVPASARAQAPFATGERRRGKGRDRRSTEAALVIRQTLEAAVLLELMPRSQITVVLQAWDQHARSASPAGLRFRGSLRLAGVAGRRGCALLRSERRRDGACRRRRTAARHASSVFCRSLGWCVS